MLTSCCNLPAVIGASFGILLPYRTTYNFSAIPGYERHFCNNPLTVVSDLQRSTHLVLGFPQGAGLGGLPHSHRVTTASEANRIEGSR